MVIKIVPKYYLFDVIKFAHNSSTFHSHVY